MMESSSLRKVDPASSAYPLPTGRRGKGKYRNWFAAAVHLAGFVGSFFPGLMLWLCAHHRHSWLARQGRRAAGFQLAFLAGCMLVVPVFKFSGMAPGKVSSAGQLLRILRHNFIHHPADTLVFLLGITGFGILYAIWIVLILFSAYRAACGREAAYPRRLDLLRKWTV